MLFLRSWHIALDLACTETLPYIEKKLLKLLFLHEPMMDGRKAIEVVVIL